MYLLLVTSASAAKKANIVIFLSDDHGWVDTPVYSNMTSAKTPHMQSLAEQGMVFNNSFVASPSCGPSRATLLSGLMPARTRRL